MLPGDAGDTSDGRTAADNATARSVFIIGPDKKIKVSLTYPMTTGRKLRRDPADSRLGSAHRQGAGCHAGELASRATTSIIVPSVSDDAAKEKYPDGWESPLPYIRLVKQP